MQNTMTAIDLFCGAGGATQGLIDAGLKVIGAVEFDSNAAATYRANHPGVQLWQSDIQEVAATEMRKSLGIERGELTLLKSCPPCQGFSSLAEGRIPRDDPRNELVRHTARFVRAFRPKIVMIENVTGLGRDPRSAQLSGALRKQGYVSKVYQVNASDYGVPQNRKRIIILAIRGLRTQLPASLSPEETTPQNTVRMTFSQLQNRLQKGDPLSEPRVLSGKVLARVQAIPPEGNRFDLPEKYQLDCHRRLATSGKTGAAKSYARLKWDDVSPTLTTRCTTPACGPYLHPELHRPITLREAAALQTFPPNYEFVGTRGQIEKQIGNAVPIKMADQIARKVIGLYAR